MAQLGINLLLLVFLHINRVNLNCTLIIEGSLSNQGTKMLRNLLARCKT